MRQAGALALQPRRHWVEFGHFGDHSRFAAQGYSRAWSARKL